MLRPRLDFQSGRGMPLHCPYCIGVPVGELPDMNAEEMAKEGFYLVKSVLRHRYRQGWRFLTLWEGFGVEEATWEPFSAFVLPATRGHGNTKPTMLGTPQQGTKHGCFGPGARRQQCTASRESCR